MGTLELAWLCHLKDFDEKKHAFVLIPYRLG